MTKNFLRIKFHGVISMSPITMQLIANSYINIQITFFGILIILKS